MKPVIAIVGRPNVGKSTLFNRLTKSRDAIVADFSGLTRDRHYGDGRLGERDFIVVDTGGFEPDSTTGIVQEMARQTRQAVAEADAVIFVVDVRAGVSAQDHDIARYLRSLGKRIILAVNKAEGMVDSPHLAEFHELGIGEPHPISSAHGQGIRSLIDAALVDFEPAADDEESDPTGQPIRLAVAGRPNVGKSTLINTWLGEERLIAFDMPGTTRDAISVPFERNGQRFQLIDTAGLRRKGRVFEAVEKFSVVKTLQAIADADVVLLLLDATQGVSDQDAHIAGYILESGRAVVIAVNKWDAVDTYQKETAAALHRTAACLLEIRAGAPHLRHTAPGTRSGVEGDRGRACLGPSQDDDARADAPRSGSSGVAGAEALRHVPPEAALCAPGRDEPAGGGGSWQFARTRDRRLQALPGNAHPCAFQADGDAAADRDAVGPQPVRTRRALIA